MKQYEVRLQSKNSPLCGTVNITCNSPEKALTVAAQEYPSFDVLGVIDSREAHYFYNEIDASK